MFSCGVACATIKDLKDLSFLWVGVTIDMQDLKDLKRRFFTRTLAGDRPPRYGEKSVPYTVGRGPVPRRASIGTGNGWLAFGFRVGRTIAGDRPPRYELILLILEIVIILLISC